MFNSINRVLAASKARREESEQGFTLIELLVVVLIIGILSAVAIPIFLGQQVAARDSAVQSDITNAKVAVVSLIVNDPNVTFPTDLYADLAEFTPAADSQLEIFGDALGFCIQGSSLANGSAAKTYAASDVTGTSEGSCNGAVYEAP